MHKKHKFSAVIEILAIYSSFYTSEAIGDDNDTCDFRSQITIGHCSQTSLASHETNKTNTYDELIYNDSEYETLPAHVDRHQQSVYKHRKFAQNVGKSTLNLNKTKVYGNVIWVNDPYTTFKLVEPGEPGGCAKRLRATVSESATIHNCMVAVNAGFFNSTDNTCKGNLINNGVEINKETNAENVHFGITKNRSLFTGYLSRTHDIIDEFHFLIGASVWLVRDGKNYVKEAIEKEPYEMQELGSLQDFANVISGRTAIGHDSEGKVVLVQVDGRSYARGINLYDFADLLILMGVKNAVNTDGGGSVTLVINNIVVNHPSDYYVDDIVHYTHEREVSTIFCVRP